MNRLIFTVLLSAPLVLLTTCHKHPNNGTGNPIENTDQDYFDCKIDGVPWAGPLSDIHLNYYCACDSVLNISAYRNGDGYQQEMHLISDQAVVGDTGNVLYGTGGFLYGDYLNQSPCSGAQYYPYRNGKVFLQELNTTKGYLKGTFWIYGRVSGCPSDTVMKFTEGRFLIHF